MRPMILLLLLTACSQVPTAPTTETAAKEWVILTDDCRSAEPGSEQACPDCTVCGMYDRSEVYGCLPCDLIPGLYHSECMEPELVNRCFGPVKGVR